MTEEEQVQSKLAEKFDYLKDKITIKRARRIFVSAPFENFSEVFSFLNQLGFNALSTISGLDENDTYGVVYHLNKEGRIVLSLKVNFPKDKSIQSVAAYFPAADAYERELIDLLGIKVSGLAPGSRYPLPDDWPKDEHPLLKSYKVEVSK